MEFKDLIRRYKELIRQDNNAGEVYKWKFVKRFNETFDLKATNFTETFKKSLSKEYNLLFQNSKGFIVKAVTHFPEEVREMFRILYDEKKPLQNRFEYFKNESEKLLPKVKKALKRDNLNHQQDGRTISVYLAGRYPDKYSIFKDDVYQFLLSTQPNEVPRKPGQKFFHYLEIAKRLLPLIDEDAELNQLVRNTLNQDCYQGYQGYLIFQDILWRNKFIPNSDTKYFLLGAWWKGSNPVDQTERFVKDGIWENGDDGKFIEETNSIPEGARVAIKAVYTEAKTKSVMLIKAMGTVTKNHLDGRHLEVEWEKNFSSFKHDAWGYWRTVHELTKQQHINAIFFRNEKQETNTSTKMAKNIILYGPPGTGKTYTTIDYAVRLALDGHLNGNSQEHSKNKERFDELREKGQIAFITFHQNYSYEDFVMGIKPDLSNDKLKFERYEGVFYKINQEAKENYRRTMQQDSSGAFVSYTPEELAKEMKISVSSVREKIRKTLGNKSSNALPKGFTIEKRSGVYFIDVPINYDFNKQEQVISDSNEQETLKNFVLVIDEINRANISRVFGELITLLEEDKRIAAENALTVKLPNGENFGVPPNLYIIGTMNTADKSIALVDVALRRRFEFLGFYPSENTLNDLIKTNLMSEKAKKLLTQVNQKISKIKGNDFLIGHAYFINKNTEAEIVETLERKVIPLLSEYFSGKPDTIKEVFSGSDYTVAYDEAAYKWNIQPNV